MIYAIVANSKKLTSVTILSYLKMYHLKYFPLITEEKILKKVSPELFLLRAPIGASPGDVLGYITQKSPLSSRDVFYCIPIDPTNMSRISKRTDQKLNYIHDNSLQELTEKDKQNLDIGYRTTKGIYFLAHYLYMLENDKNELSRKPDIKGYILTDRYFQWKTEETFRVQKWVGYNQQRKVIKNEQIVYTRFEYEDVTSEPYMGGDSIDVIKVAQALGFKIVYRIADELFEKIDKKTFNALDNLVEIIFIGKNNWKDKLGFKIDLVFYNKMLQNGREDHWLIERKPIYLYLNNCSLL